MSIVGNFQRVLASGLEDYHAPKRDTICGVQIYFKPVPGGTSWRDWREPLEEWLPRFEEVGWLKDFHSIRIGENMVYGEAVGRYNHYGSIDLENDVGMGGLYTAVYEDSREHVLVHEMVHHAHMYLNGFEEGNRPPERRAYIRNKVSWYAGSDIYETVAEIGAALARGEDIPNEAIRIYDMYDGPQEAKEF